MRLSALLLVVALLAASLATAAAAPSNPMPRLWLHRTLLDQTPRSIAAARALSAPSGPYAIVQLRGPIAPADRAALEQTGVALLEYVPDFAYLVRGSPDQIAAAARLPQVVSQAALTLADKLDPRLLRALARGDASVGQVRVLGWPDDGGTLDRDMRAAAISPASLSDVDTLLRAAALPSVRWIEPAPRPRLLNDVARAIMHVDAAWQDRGLYGAGQIIGVADSGLDTGNPKTISADFAGRLVATHVLATGGDLADTFGHGTHVAGSAAGAGAQSGARPAQHQYAGSFAGVAPEAGLVIQAFEANAQGEIIGLDPDYYKLFGQAYADGARLHTNSWGDTTSDTPGPAQYGGYPSGSRDADRFTWDHPDMAIFFAAGNSGRDGVPDSANFCQGGDGVVDPDSLLAPGTAKNVITVGAAESLRSSGGYSELPWFYFDQYSFCFATPPIKDDLPSNNAEGMAAFSSRGPADDGRSKPDIVAPGINIVSDRSHEPNAGTLWGVYASNNNYVYSGGTSMATPLVAGAGALTRQWLIARGIPNPSAAAVKATLLDTTHDMGPGQYGTGTTQEIPATRPNNVEGWGRVDLSFMSAPPYAIWVDDHAGGLATGQSFSYASAPDRSLTVVDSAQPLRIMLAWTDPPGSLSAQTKLVNDLDLIVTGPGGATYRGNNVPGGDRLNNVEGIVIDRPPPGQYKVEVRGYNVPIATQPYAMVVAGPLVNVGSLALTKTAEPAQEVAPGDLITYTLALKTDRSLDQAVVLSDTLPLHTSFVSASDGGVLSGSIVTWSIPSLAPDTTLTRRLVARVDLATGGDTAIVNARYGAIDGADPPTGGPPVSVKLRTVEPAGVRKLYMSAVAR
ncbi:MAG TPA: S8 family serine peptidase [Roseiflexaceae bacterium]|nr:S8 family serine peptidase [Roseiflexaceae bacterium]